SRPRRSSTRASCASPATGTWPPSPPPTAPRPPTPPPPPARSGATFPPTRSRPMPGWSLLVDPTRALLFALAHLTGGSLGAAILLLSALVRLALLPLGVRLALQARRTQ